MINLLARMGVASIKDGLATTTMIAVMDRMKESSVIHNTRHVRHKNSLVRTLNAFAINIDAVRILIYEFAVIINSKIDSTFQTAKMIAVIIPMKSIARRRTILALPDNSLATMANVLTTRSCATKLLTVQMNRMNLCIVTLMNVPRLRFISADINVLTH